MRHSGETAKYILQEKYGFDGDRADRILQIARECGLNNEPVTGGYVTVEYRKLRERNLRYTITDNAGNSSRKSAGRVANAPTSRYTQERRRTVTPGRKVVMPAKTRARAAVAAPEPEVIEDEDTLYDLFVDKPLTPTMKDFVEWFQTEVSALKGIPAEQLLVAGIRAYGTFQKSEFNRERRDARREARAAAAPSNGQAAEQEEDEAPARPAKRTARKAPPAAAAAAPAPARPAKRPRSRSAGVPAEPF